MAYEYDRFEREEGGGSFLMGLLAGTVLGAGLGMLFAPKAGSELRSQLGTQLSDSPARSRGPGLPAGEREGEPDRGSRPRGLRPRARQHGGGGHDRRRQRTQHHRLDQLRRDRQHRIDRQRRTDRRLRRVTRCDGRSRTPGSQCGDGGRGPDGRGLHLPLAQASSHGVAGCTPVRGGAARGLGRHDRARRMGRIRTAR